MEAHRAGVGRVEAAVLCPGAAGEPDALLLALGAALVADRRNPDGIGWAVLADPEGNEFCVLRSAAERAAGGF
ncbi:VOC family protein [Kitasatospora sp. NPDC002227]|uniref:VOC family protein n=1 Tax=Kitasatospora sp. NPDC002227 TaxID=3154773 RepID=UPI00331BBEC3